MCESKMKIWFPTIRAGTGADIFIINLAKGLRENGVSKQRSRGFPHLSRAITPPTKVYKSTKECRPIIHSNSWYGFAFSNS